MTTSTFIKGFIVAFIVSIVGDYLWHSVLLADFYNQRLTAINGAPTATTFPPFIVLFEVIGSAGIAYFILATHSKTLWDGAWRGGLLGLMLGSGINFVDHSLIAKWDLTMALVDTAWATVLTAIGGAIIVAVCGKKAS